MSSERRIGVFMKVIALVLLGLSVFAGCSRETSSNVYDDTSIGEASSTYPGVVMQMQEVSVTNGDGLQNNTTGLIGGGLAGALLGSTIGHGNGSVVASVAGGIVGATGGAALEQGLKNQKAMQYIVQLENGELKTIVQGIEPALIPGQNVYVMISSRGRSRIIER